MNAELQRLEETRTGRRPWHKWGPYLSERQWGTVREDYSEDGEAWEYFPYEMARSRAYRWGEDGLAGLSDHRQRLCVALALWNGRDPFLKERLFGLTNAEGNHGEDVKELYYYLDATPTHSYLKMLYKYPQLPFPYDQLREANAQRSGHEEELELLDTGVFQANRYFDVFVEYAKADVEDILLRVTAYNRGKDDAQLHILPQIWFRNTWSWGYNDGAEPSLGLASDGRSLLAEHPTLGSYRFFLDGNPELLFCENDTNRERLFGTGSRQGYFKDAFHDYVVGGKKTAVNPRHRGTKAAAHYRFVVPGGGSVVVRARLAKAPMEAGFDHFDEVLALRRREADEFYAAIQEGVPSGDARKLQRQAFAGLIWSTQFYYYDVRRWLEGDPAQPAPPASRRKGRNADWLHLNNADVISMPDKWEYPWYAAWDLAFHCIPFALIDAEFAKCQLVLITREWYMHPSGKIPAYEWNFDEANPPVHAWAAWRVYQIDRKATGKADRAFLERIFHKFLINFTWWVNRKDQDNRHIFQGGFLGLDNIGVIDRRVPLANGGHLDQADGTSWMAMYCLNMLRIALELALENPVYEDIATKFFEHFLYIAKAMNNIGDQGIGLWDETDEFYYDVLHLPDGRMQPLKLRSLVGLTPLLAVETIEPELLKRLPGFARRLDWFLKYRPDLAGLVSHWDKPGSGQRRLLSLLRGHRMKCLLRRMLDPAEFLSNYGIRSLSRHHREHPYELVCDGHVLDCGGEPLVVRYDPSESTSHMFGGNSNWRGPIWFPVNYLIIESLQKFHHYYGDEFRVECPTGSGNMMTLNEVADELSRRLARIFLRDPSGYRPVFGRQSQMQTDPHFRDYLLFSEYFHGDSGRGVGASHQTGWTALIAKLLQPKRDPVH
ncbi:MAG: glucosidase [Thermogutta sp.]|uniref:MGH1-like glycoside hydrolase domain-containing protein n=1 Tax=Thermogutta sp. TaxID=1962930 RepID=UPI00198F39C8|nr:glucosidase [Thermogutta sp.]MBC7350759.1 glucosidase [Thermogutta sp.]